MTDQTANDVRKLKRELADALERITKLEQAISQMQADLLARRRT